MCTMDGKLVCKRVLQKNCLVTVFEKLLVKKKLEDHAWVIIKWLQFVINE
jgi:hypothetical protein